MENEPPYILDIEPAIQSMINNKTPGRDNDKKGYLQLSNVLHCLIKMVWIEGKVPAEWKTNIIVTIYKKRGDKLQRHNYREISLICTGYKIVTNYSVTIIHEYHYYAQDTKLWQITVSQL